VAHNAESVAPAGADRRTSARVDLEIEVGLETETNFYTGLTQDIGAGGLFVATHELRKRGDKLVVKFTLPGAPQPIVVNAEVRWLRDHASLAGSRADHQPMGMGLKFLDLPPPARGWIAAFLKKRESIFFDDE
jgi:uncharacterized protein (TIGR02266 family)